MRSRRQAMANFLKFIYCARKWNSFHSPYLFRLFSKAADETIAFPYFKAIEEKRKEFLRSEIKIKRLDLGAGSLHHKSSDQISMIARSSLSRPFQCRFMARLVHEVAPKTILELGTSLGISTAYMGLASPQAHIITVEGDPAIAGLAKSMFEKLAIKNIELVNANFDDYIVNALAAEQPLDLLFIDGNHQGEYLLKYFRALSKVFHESTIVIVDDIHWSADMHDAWKKLISEPRVTQSVDCFHFGLLFFNPDFIGQEEHMIRLPLRSYFQ